MILRSRLDERGEKQIIKKSHYWIVSYITGIVLLFPLCIEKALAAPIDNGYVTTHYLNLRSAPNTGSVITGYLTQNTGIQILNELPNGWMSVQTDKGTGYVKGIYVKRLKSWEEKSDVILQLGKTFTGTPYVFGAERFQIKSFDCSSFVQYLYSNVGIALGWNSREQAIQGDWIPFNEMRKGDLMFFSDEDYPNESGLNKVRHVGIYVGEGKILHTYEVGTGVIISELRNDAKEADYWYEHFLFAKRVL